MKIRPAAIVPHGGGIVGLSVARAALRHGCAATVLEAGELPHPHGASHDQHRMIRLHHGARLGDTRMAEAAFTAWDRVWADLGARHFENVGALAISLRAGDFADATRETFERAGIAHQALDARRVRGLCPHLAIPDGARGLLAYPGGVLYAERILQDLLAYLAAEGADLRAASPVTRIDPSSGRVEIASGEVVEGDLVVAAVGSWLPELLPQEFGHLPTFRQALCYVRPPEPHRESWASSPALVCIGDEDLHALPPCDGTGLKLGYGPHRRAQPPSAGFHGHIDESRSILSAFAPYLRDGPGYEAYRIKVGYYTLSASPSFLVSRVGRRVVIGNCGGQMFKFGPLIGDRLMADLAAGRDLTDGSRWASSP